MEQALKTLKKNLSPSFSQKQRLWILASSLLLFFLFGLFTLIVRAHVLRSFDFNTTVRLQNHIPVKFDNLFSLLSITGRFEISIVLLLLLFLAKRKLTAIVALAFFGIAHIVEIIGKSFLTQPGPPHMFLRTTSLSMDFPGLYVSTDASYPSGHALRVTFIFIILVLLSWRSKRMPAYLKYIITGLSVLYVGLMLLSRVSLGEHWTTDIIGGSLLGSGFALFSLLFL